MKLIFENNRAKLDRNAPGIITAHCYKNLSSCFEDGLLIYECEPKQKSLSVGGEQIKLKLPYMYFVVRYIKDVYYNKWRPYIYPSIYGSGLHVYASPKKISSFEDDVYTLPTDLSGHACLDHRYDFARFSSKEELVNFIISLWYGSFHADERQFCPQIFSSKDIKNSYSTKDWSDWPECLPKFHYCFRSKSKFLWEGEECNKFGYTLSWQKFYGSTVQIEPHIWDEELHCFKKLTV